MNHLWAPWRMTYVGGEQTTDGCFLCLLNDDPDHPGRAHLVDASPLTLAVLNRFPYSSGHLLVVPRRHVGSLVELDEAEASALMAAIQRSVTAVTSALGAEGVNIGLNHGEAAGASIDHVHFHVVPRWHGDTNFMPVLADTKVLPEHLDATADRLRSAFANPTATAP